MAATPDSLRTTSKGASDHVRQAGSRSCVSPVVGHRGLGRGCSSDRAVCARARGELGPDELPAGELRVGEGGQGRRRRVPARPGVLGDLRGQARRSRRADPGRPKQGRNDRRRARGGAHPGRGRGRERSGAGLAEPPGATGAGRLLGRLPGRARPGCGGHAARAGGAAVCGHRPGGRPHRGRGDRRRQSGGVLERRADPRHRDGRAHPRTPHRRLSQPYRRACAALGDWAGVRDRERAHRRGGWGARLRGHRHPDVVSDRRAVRHRHRLHPLPALPLPRAAARRRACTGSGRARGRARRRADRFGGADRRSRVRRAPAGQARALQDAGARTDHRGARRPRRCADARARDPRAPRPPHLLALEGVAEDAGGDTVPRPRRVGRSASVERRHLFGRSAARARRQRAPLHRRLRQP